MAAAGGSLAAAVVLLVSGLACVFYRRSQKPLNHGDDDEDIDALGTTKNVVNKGRTLAAALLTAGSALPLIGELCAAAQDCLGSAEEIDEKTEDAIIAAHCRRTPQPASSRIRTTAPTSLMAAMGKFTI